MELAPLIADRYREWDDFCLMSDDAWFWHTSGWLLYTQNYKPGLKSTSMSFMIINNSGIEGICPVFLETKKSGEEETRELSFGGAPCFMPALKNGLTQEARDKRLKAIFEQIDKLAEENDVAKASFRSSPLSPSFLNCEEPSYNYLMRFGFIPIPLNSHIINLSKSLKELWADVRHGHKYDIRRGLREIETDIFSEGTITRDVFEEYRSLHRKAAGRVTRPSMTFELMYDWIKQGNAVLVGGEIAGQFIGFSYVFVYKNRAYYGSACNDPDHDKKPIGHVLQWETMNWLKEHGYRYYEVGLQQYGPLPYDLVSEKEVAISTFKRGFGGFTVPLFVGEKYYSKNNYLSVNLDRIQKYASYIKKLKI